MIEFRTLGAVDLVAADGRDLVALTRQPKRVAMLAYLAVAGRGVFVRRDRLVALFWPDVDSERGRSSLRTGLHRIRAALGPDAIIARGLEEVRLNGDLVCCDAAALRAAAEAGHHAEVLARFRGEFLDGFLVHGVSAEFEQWVDVERQQLRRLAMRSGWEIVNQLTRAGRTLDATAVAHQVVTLAPLEETGVRRLLDLLIAAGDHAGAAAAYDRFCAGLKRELDVEPAAETQAIGERLRARMIRGQPSERAGLLPTGAASHRAVTKAAGSSPAGDRPDDAMSGIASTSPTRAPRRWRFRWVGAGTTVLLLAAAASLAWRRHSRPAAAAAGRWEALPATAPDPFPRWHPVALFDSTARRILVFGGRQGATNLADLWRGTLDSGGIHWSRIRSSTTGSREPGGLWLSAAAYSPRADRLMLFGGSTGYSAPCTADLWFLDNVSGMTGAPSWRQVPRVGAWPAPRAEHRMAYDETTNRLLLLGGHDCVAPVFTDLWILKHADGTTGMPAWEQLSPDTSGGAPRGLRGFALAYNAASDRAIVFGGYDNATHAFFGDTWVLTNAIGLAGRPAWHRLRVIGDVPPGRIGAAFGYDAATNRLVVALGEADTVLRDVWVLVGADGTTPESRWVRLAASGAFPGTGPARSGVFDPVGDRLYVMSGGVPGELPTGWVLLGATGR